VAAGPRARSISAIKPGTAKSNTKTRWNGGSEAAENKPSAKAAASGRAASILRLCATSRSVSRLSKAPPVVPEIPLRNEIGFDDNCDINRIELGVDDRTFAHKTPEPQIPLNERR